MRKDKHQSAKPNPAIVAFDPRDTIQIIDRVAESTSTNRSAAIRMIILDWARRFGGIFSNTENALKE